MDGDWLRLAVGDFCLPLFAVHAKLPPQPCNSLIQQHNTLCLNGPPYYGVA